MNALITTMQRSFRFSIIVPIYQNELNIPVTVPELLKLETANRNFELELVFVDDGSQDASLAKLKEQQLRYPKKIKIIKLTKNFGQIQAIRAGLQHTTGDCVGIISADLQDPPELFLKMIEMWLGGLKLVIAERKDREEKGIGAFLSKMYWKLVRKLALENYPVGGFDFCLLDRQIVENLNKIHEKNTQIFPLIFSLGYNYGVVKYTRRRRELGESQWTFWKKFKVFVDTFIAFSYAPMRAVTFLGCLFFIFSIIYGIYTTVFYFFWGSAVTGWTTLAILISSSSGLIMLSLGVIGEYLWRILDQVRKRPLYIVEDVLQSKMHES